VSSALQVRRWPTFVVVNNKNAGPSLARQQRITGFSWTTTDEQDGTVPPRESRWSSSLWRWARSWRSSGLICCDRLDNSKPIQPGSGPTRRLLQRNVPEGEKSPGLRRGPVRIDR
jgi:hypothetical protein